MAEPSHKERMPFVCLENSNRSRMAEAFARVHGGDACPFAGAKARVDWEVPDPKHLPPSEFNKIRDLIEQKVCDAITGMA